MYYVLIIFNVLFLLILSPWEIEDSLFFFFFLAMAMQHASNLSSLTRDQTHASCTESTEYQPLDHQGSPHLNALKKLSALCSHI